MPPRSVSRRNLPQIAEITFFNLRSQWLTRLDGMTQELVSLTIIMAVAAVSPIVAQLIPGRFIPQTVLLLVTGAALGPYGLGVIEVNDAVKLLSELGMAFLFLQKTYRLCLFTKQFDRFM